MVKRLCPYASDRCADMVNHNPLDQSAVRNSPSEKQDASARVYANQRPVAHPEGFEPPTF